MWEKNIDWLPSIYSPTRDWTCNPGMCGDWGSNVKPFDAWEFALTKPPGQSQAGIFQKNPLSSLLQIGDNE